MKKFLLILLLVVLLGLGFGFKYLIDRAPIFTGYAAKEVASSLFVDHRDFQDVKEHDINFSLIPLSDIRVDSSEKAVYTNFLGFAKQKAVYRQGLGCALIADGDENYAKSMKSVVTPLPEYPEDIFWPTGNKLRDTVISGVNLKKLNDAIDSALASGNTRALQNRSRTA